MSTEDQTNAVQVATSSETRAKELAALRARRIQLDNERAAKQAAAEEDEELEAERRAVVDSEALNRAIDEHGQVGKVIGTLETDLGLVIVKRASAMRFKRFTDTEDTSYENCLKLVRPSLVYPPSDKFDLMIEQQPAIAVRAANKLAVLAGVRREELQKK